MTRWLFSCVHCIEQIPSDPIKFDSQVIETITVHENGCSNVLF